MYIYIYIYIHPWTLQGLGLMILYTVGSLQFLCIHSSTPEDPINWGILLQCSTVIFTLEKISFYKSLDPCSSNPYCSRVSCIYICIYTHRYRYRLMFSLPQLLWQTGHKRQCSLHLALPVSLGTCFGKKLLCCEEAQTMCGSHMWTFSPTASVRFPIESQYQSPAHEWRHI